MIEGHRHLPWVKAAFREQRSLGSLMDCTRCRATRSKEERQDMGCGYETPIENPDTVWCHEGFNRAAYGTPTRCLGYSCKLPDVLQTNVLMEHWDNGTLAQRLGVVIVPQIVFDRIDEMRIQDAAVDAHQQRVLQKKLGAKGGAQ